MGCKFLSIVKQNSNFLPVYPSQRRVPSASIVYKHPLLEAYVLALLVMSDQPPRSGSRHATDLLLLTLCPKRVYHFDEQTERRAAAPRNVFRRINLRRPALKIQLGP